MPTLRDPSLLACRDILQKLLRAIAATLRVPFLLFEEWARALAAPVSAERMNMRRLATAQDIDDVFAIYSHTKVVPYLTYDPMTLQNFGPVFDELLGSGCFHVWERDGAIAGFYKATRYPGRARHVALLGTLAVDPRHQGQGEAPAMVLDAIAWLRTDGVRRVELYAESDNAQALAFYRKLGFVHEGTLRAFYKRAHEAHYVDEYVLGLLLE